MWYPKVGIEYYLNINIKINDPLLTIYNMVN